MAQKDIQSVLQEERVFTPSAEFRKHAALKAGELQAMYAKAENDYVGFWADLALAEIAWRRPDSAGLECFFNTHGFGSILRQQARRIAAAA